MFYLKATKTSLYQLVVEKFQAIPWVYIPAKKKDMMFQKVRYHHDYFMRWGHENYTYKVFLATVGGRPHLSIECSVDCGGDAGHNREVAKLTLEELQERGMLKEVTP